MHNEEASLAESFERLMPAFEALDDSVEVACVNDGSHGGPLAGLLAMRQREPHIRVLDLSRNFGRGAALTCGIDHARGDAVAPIDADPQTLQISSRKWRRSGTRLSRWCLLSAASEAAMIRSSASSRARSWAAAVRASSTIHRHWPSPAISENTTLRSWQESLIGISPDF